MTTLQARAPRPGGVRAAVRAGRSAPTGGGLPYGHAELDMRPLDVGDRREAPRGQHGLDLCNITKCCTDVCLAGIKITNNAIIPMKERAVDERYDPLRFVPLLEPPGRARAAGG